MKGLSECKASESNFRRIQVKDIIKEVEDYLKTYSSAGMDNSCLPRKWLSINQTQRANNSIKNDCLATLHGKYNYEEGLIDQVYQLEIQRFSIQASSSKPLISNNKFQDNDSYVEEDQRTNNEFMADLNAEYHERALLANQKRFYKRSGTVRSARKPIDKTKETCFACGKTNHFQKDWPSNKTSIPSYSSSNNSFNKPKPYTPPFNQIAIQNTGFTLCNMVSEEKEYDEVLRKVRGGNTLTILLPFEEEQAELKDNDSDVEEDQRTNNEFIADLNAEYHERALLANQKRFYKRSGTVRSARKPIDKTKETCFACGKTGHFQKDEESVSSKDERATRIRAFMAIAKDEPSVRKVDARYGQWVGITMKKTYSKVTLDQLLSEQVPGNIVNALRGKGRRKNNLLKEVIFIKVDEYSSKPAPDITFDSKTDYDTQEPLFTLPKLIGQNPLVP
nr:hypothetical protein [Tanacetum cinerariifolium]